MKLSISSRYEIVDVTAGAQLGMETSKILIL